jgi:hypothetical protein
LNHSSRGVNNPQYGKKGELSPAWKGGEVDCICEWCDNPFKARQDEVKIGKGRFCGRECSGLAERGDGHWNWQGGKTKLSTQIRANSKYRKWRNSVVKIKGSSCEKCGDSEGIFHVDHYPKLFAEILKDNNIKTLKEAEACEELWSIDNARVYCKKCHHERHAKNKSETNINIEMKSSENVKSM